MTKIAIITSLLLATVTTTAGQEFLLRRSHDSLYWLNDWRLPYPVYRFATGDVDGDGRDEALVGVVKATRFYPERGRRLFVMKQISATTPDGRHKVRPLWMGSRLGGVLHDFRYAGEGRVRALETTTDSLWVVADYRWSGFGLAFDRFLVKGTDFDTATKYFYQ